MGCKIDSLLLKVMRDDKKCVKWGKRLASTDILLKISGSTNAEHREAFYTLLTRPVLEKNSFAGDSSLELIINVLISCLKLEIFFHLFSNSEHSQGVSI